jgi:hypothetical protein
VRDTLNIEEQLGYTYEFTPGDPPPRAEAAEAMFPTHPAIDFALSGRKPPALVRTLDITVPEPGLTSAQLQFTGVNVATPFSYGADIYLTPAGEDIRTTDRRFRERLLADLLYFWKAHHHDGAHGRHTIDLIADVGNALRSLADAHAGEPWRVSVALTASDGGHPHDHGGAVETAADVAGEMNFGDLRLKVD